MLWCYKLEMTDFVYFGNHARELPEYQLEELHRSEKQSPQSRSRHPSKLYRLPLTPFDSLLLAKPLLSTINSRQTLCTLFSRVSRDLMGIVFSSLWQRLMGTEEIRVVILGLEYLAEVLCCAAS